MKCVISVLGKDRSGIVAAVATTLAECSANIDDISQTILGQGEIFSMTMLTTLAPEACDFNTVQEKLEKVGEDLGVQIIIQREDVFQFMYKIERDGAVDVAMTKRPAEAERFCFVDSRCRAPWASCARDAEGRPGSSGRQNGAGFRKGGQKLCALRMGSAVFHPLDIC